MLLYQVTKNWGIYWPSSFAILQGITSIGLKAELLQTQQDSCNNYIEQKSIETWGLLANIP